MIAKPAPSTRRPADLLAILALLAACFAVYGQTLGFGFINFDDPGYVYENPMVARGLSWESFHWAWTTFDQANWHPLTWLSLLLDAQLYGLNAGGYHLTNLLFHAANSALVFVWLRRAAGAFWPSLAVAFFFAVHPLHVESVAWVTERKDVLSTFFCLLALLAYTGYARQGSKWRYALSLVCFSIGLTAKPMLVTLPALLLLVDFWPLRQAGLGWRILLLEKAPFFALSVASGMVTLIAQRAGNAMVPYGALSLIERIGGIVTAGGAYVGATFWPVDLGVYYPYWPFSFGAKYPHWPQRPLWQPIVSAIVLVGLSIAAWRGRRAAPYAAMGWAWFVVALLPVVGVLKVGGAAMADRYTYLPHIGLFIALAWGGADLWARWRLLRPLIAGVAGLAAAGCVTLAIQQAGYWRDSVTLFAHTLQVTRRSVMLCTLYGDACRDAHRYQEADLAYHEGLRVRPDDPDILAKLGYLSFVQDKIGQAIQDFERADRIRPNEPGNLSNLGYALSQAGRHDEAIAAFQRCVKTNPRWLAARLGLGEALMQADRHADAKAEYEAALVLQPDNPQALNSLAWLYALGAGPEMPPDPPRALPLAQRAVQSSGGKDANSLEALAVALAANGRWDAAVEIEGAAIHALEQVGAPEDALAIRRERVALYQARQLPRR